MDYDLALDCFNRVLDYHYDDSETLLEIYSCYYYSRDYDCAFHYFNKLLKEKPENTDLLTHIGNCYLYIMLSTQPICRVFIKNMKPRPTYI